MALLNAEIGFDINHINFGSINFFADQVDFYDNEYLTFAGYTYADLLDVFWLDSDYNTYFAGDEIKYDEFAGVVNGGVIKAIFEDMWFYGSYDRSWSLEGISISASALWKASLTASQDDDRIVVSQALSGADRFELSNFDDNARGYGGNDLLLGYAGNDRLYGDAGNDKLNGGTGADRLQGGAGQDTLTGEAGADDFVYTKVSDSTTALTGRDVIIGFAKGYDDIVVSAIDAKTGVSGDQAFALNTNSTFSAGEINQKIASNGLVLEFNVDTDATVEMAILLQGLTSRLAASDFVL